MVLSDWNAFTCVKMGQLSLSLVILGPIKDQVSLSISAAGVVIALLLTWRRYELEKELVEGSVKVEQLPKLWNERMTSYLGCTPADDAQGVLQDVHWSAGLFGYFPTYTLGAMFACQIYQVLYIFLLSLKFYNNNNIIM